MLAFRPNARHFSRPEKPMYTNSHRRCTLLILLSLPPYFPHSNNDPDARRFLHEIKGIGLNHYRVTNTICLEFRFSHFQPFRSPIARRLPPHLERFVKYSCGFFILISSFFFTSTIIFLGLLVAFFRQQVKFGIACSCENRFTRPFAL